MFEIGNSLREARDRQGRSFPDLERKTQIRTRYLRALEEEDFSAMPALAYTRGFLRVYADELGLDGQLYVDEFNSRFALPEDGNAPFRRRETRAPTHRARKIASLAVVVAIGTIGAVLALFVAAFSSNTHSPQTVGQTNKTPAHMATVKLTAMRGDVSVEAHRGGEGGDLLFGGTLVKGRSQTFSAARLWIKVSAAQNIRWTLAGGNSADTRDRFGPATVIFTPGGHTFLPG
ncbi:MAG: helix-turn-helix domain-containing protein [Gaiellaceae bacterium]